MKQNYILLVEDNPDHEALTLRALQKAGLLNPVVVARDGAQAINLLEDTGELPQVVLLDLKLPKVDGLEVLQKMRATPRTHLVPVVILTSSDEESDLVSSYRLGANSYIRKPVDFNQFIEAARQLGLYWLVLNQSPRMSK